MNPNRWGVGLGLAGALGLRWQVGGAEARLNAYLDAHYHVQSIGSVFDTKGSADTIVSTGTTDNFHGPRAGFGASF